jgi:lipoprotein-anchoring transpeptidase ErfK/SrfK
VNTLKSAALIVVLLGVLYGVYVALNKPSQPGAGYDSTDLEAPEVEFGPADPRERGPKYASSSPSLVPSGNEPSPASQGGTRSSSSGKFQPNLDTGNLPPPTTPPTSLDQRASSTGSPASSAPGSSGSLPSLDLAPPTASAAAAGSSSSPASPALAAWSLRRDWQEAEQFVTDGKLKAALAKLSPYYASPDLPPDQRASLTSWLDALAAKVIYSREHLLAGPYQVRKNETLFEIADQHQVPWLLLQSINSQAVSDPLVLVPGTELKVVPGPFRADVNVGAGELTLFLGELYAGRFPLTVGDQPPAIGQYKIVDKMRQQKTYYGLDGRVIPANDPSNPYGGWWLSLGGEVCIHGSPATPGTQTLGCISLSPQDAKDVYGILAIGSDVTVRR